MTETSRRDQWEPPSATETLRASFMGRKMCVVREEDNVRGGVFAEFFALEVPFCISKASCEEGKEELLFPESDCLQGEVSRYRGGE